MEQKDVEFIVGELLCKHNLTISTTESCTGGMIASKLISYPGISKVYLEGAVTYSNKSKVKKLGVKEETLSKYGAVSEQTAREMAEGMLRESGSLESISTTGIAGPEGGTVEKPVGLVYIGLCMKGRTIVERCVFSGDRNQVRKEATNYALNMLRKVLLGMEN